MDFAEREERAFLGAGIAAVLDCGLVRADRLRPRALRDRHFGEREPSRRVRRRGLAGPLERRDDERELVRVAARHACDLRREEEDRFRLLRLVERGAQRSHEPAFVSLLKEDDERARRRRGSRVGVERLLEDCGSALARRVVTPRGERAARANEQRCARRPVGRDVGERARRVDHRLVVAQGLAEPRGVHRGRR